MWSIEEFKVEMVDESDPSKRQFAWSQKNELKALADGFPAAVTAALSADSSTEGPVETRWRFTRFKQGTVPERNSRWPPLISPKSKGIRQKFANGCWLLTRRRCFAFWWRFTFAGARDDKRRLQHVKDVLLAEINSISAHVAKGSVRSTSCLARGALSRALCGCVVGCC
jgi:hypothetical protein